MPEKNKCFALNYSLPKIIFFELNVNQCCFKRTFNVKEKKQTVTYVIYVF